MERNKCKRGYMEKVQCFFVYTYIHTYYIHDSKKLQTGEEHKKTREEGAMERVHEWTSVARGSCRFFAWL
jgi:hypothetical protein